MLPEDKLYYYRNYIRLHLEHQMMQKSLRQLYERPNRNQ